VPQIVSIPRKRGHKAAAPQTPQENGIDSLSSELRRAPPVKSPIVTIRKRGRRFADVPDMTPEEQGRVGDLADALWRDMESRIKGQS
jgi:hypothetical protein